MRVRDLNDSLDQRLDEYYQSIAQPAIEIEKPEHLQDHEYCAIRERVLGSNFALYRCLRPEAVTANHVLELCRQVGLTRLDRSSSTGANCLTRLQVTRSSFKRFVPYTNRALNWHTDGYYNPADRRIRGMLLHCVTAAVAGGSNEFIDHRIVYRLLHRADPAFPAALSHHKTMTIPSDRDADGGYRPACSGPVFWRTSGQLNMRYTSRRLHIVWRDDSLTREAVAALGEILDRRSDLVFRRRLKPGEGILSNNVLHRRDAFDDPAAGAKTRLIYRGRFHDRLIVQEAESRYVCAHVQ